MKRESYLPKKIDVFVESGRLTSLPDKCSNELFDRRCAEFEKRAWRVCSDKVAAVALPA